MKNFTSLPLFALVSTAVGWSQPAADMRPGLAYCSHGILKITTISGKLLHTFKTSPEIGTFDFSPKSQRIVFAPRGPKGNGGQLYLLSLDTGKSERITHGFSYDSREVYSDPEFSPDGTEVLFAIHASSGGDAVMASGPFAILNLRSRKVRKLSATVKINGYGAAYGGSSRWSPDGRHIFLNFESGFELTDPSGQALEDTSSWIHDADMTFAVDWLGNACIVFIGGADWKEAEERPARALDLKTHQTTPLASVLGTPLQQFANLVAFSPSIWVLKEGAELTVHTDSEHWKVPGAGPDSNVRIFPDSAHVRIPENCR